MTAYVAMLRGVGPGNPKMRNENLRSVAEDLGFRNVATVISSGNVVFESDESEPEVLEAAFERAWPEQLGFESTTIVRSRADLEGLMDLAPFTDLEHGPRTYLLTTFSRHHLTLPFDLPHHPVDGDYRVVAATDRELFTVTDTTAGRTPDVMGWVERQFGKEITSRTWLTVSRIVNKMA